MLKVTPPSAILDTLKKVPNLEDFDMLKVYEKLIVNERLFEALMTVPKKFRNPYLLSLPYV
jgi:hypothetical protein